MSAQPARNRIRCDRGAILIHVGLSVMVLMAFSAFVLDYGLMWVSRRQAQNAADAGALAGAVARAFDDPSDPPPSGGRAFSSAVQTAEANLVWNQVPVVNVTWPCPFAAAGPGTTCVNVDVFRDRANNNSLPTLFAPLLGITSQQVRATATARAVTANATDCLAPIAISDRWVENQTGPWDPTATFLHWKNVGGTAVPVDVPPGSITPDVYDPPSSGGTGTGFSVSSDFGTAMTVQTTSYVAVVVPSAGGPRPFDLNGCNGTPVAVDSILSIDASVPNPAAAVQSWWSATDPGANWDSGTQTVTGSCAPACRPFSPRILALPVFDPDEYQKASVVGDWSACPGATPCVQVRNIVGFFVDSASGTEINGHFLRYPGVVTGGMTLSADAAFTVAATLVR